ncbi:MAG: MFS transporter [Patescibacteria group bacterium]|nr:MFS transporter [Patescibacteria group bacterium]
MRLSLISKILNISEHEWPRVIISWIITFFLRVGFIIGWTIIIAMFVNRIGIEKLPILLILNALLVILGTFIFSGLIEKVRREILIIFNIIIAAIFLLSASVFVLYSNWLFFGLVLIAVSIMLAQLNILISVFVEELFTPLESQRTFPIIESSETIGLIVGGIIVNSLAHTIPSYKFLYIWVLFIMLVIPIILSFKNLGTEIPSFETVKNEDKPIKRISDNFKKAQKSPFLKGLIVVIIFQWMFINLLEFQYTKSVQQDVFHEQEQTLVYENHSGDNLKISLINLEETKDNLMSTAFHSPTAQRIEAQNMQDMEDTLAAKLGLLQIFFGVASLFMQIFISSRILRGLGIIKSMSIHPLVAVVNISGMILRFNMFSAAIAKGAAEMTGVLFQNAYHSSYYVFGENMRDQMKELLEGIIKPMGAILGMSIIILLENFLFGKHLTLSINIILIAIAVLSAIMIFNLQDKYTNQSEKNMEKGNSNHTRLNAIEILGQKGHKIDYHQLVKIVLRKTESEEVKLKIVETFKQLKDPETIPHLITCLQSDNSDIRLVAIEALGTFKNLDKQFFDSAFGQFRIKNNLQKLFEEEEDEEIRSAIINVLSKLNPGDIVPFLLHKMKSKDEKIVADCVYICGKFKDQNSIHYLEDYLDNKNPNIRANAIIAMWQFKKLRTKLNHYLDQLLESNKEDNITAGIFAIGELNLKERRKYLLKLLPDKNPEVIFAAGKLSEPSAITPLLEYIMKNTNDWKTINKQLNKLPRKFQKDLYQYLHHEVSHLIHKTLKANSHLTPGEFPDEVLSELTNLYDIIHESKTKEDIEKLLRKKQAECSEEA